MLLTLRRSDRARAMSAARTSAGSEMVTGFVLGIAPALKIPSAPHDMVDHVWLIVKHDRP